MIERTFTNKGDLLNTINNTTSIRSIRCHDIGIDSLHYFFNQVNLIDLVISQNKLKSLDGIEKLINLSNLDIDNNINIVDLTPLLSTELKRIDMRYTGVSCLKVLGKMEHLKDIIINYTPDYLKQLRRMFKNKNIWISFDNGKYRDIESYTHKINLYKWRLWNIDSTRLDNYRKRIRRSINKVMRLTIKLTISDLWFSFFYERLNYLECNRFSYISYFELRKMI